MENRRPPHAKPTGRYTDRPRGNAPYRGGSGNDNSNRNRKPERTRDNRDTRYDRRTDTADDQRRRDGRPKRNDGKRFGDNSRFGNRHTRPPGRQQPGNRIPQEPQVRLTSDAQITDGKFRGRTLQNSNSPASVPTKRKIREVAFKILSRRVKACRVLDLGAASGTYGIEAISRGAMLATFVERSARLCTYIRKNLAELGIKDGHGEVVEMEILPYLKRNARRRRTWDIVFLDLPEADGHAAIVEYISRGNTVKQSGLLIIQHASSTSFPEKMSLLNRWRTVDQGETILSIYERI
jgi:16S rRNA (guanine966-N2)-methyltransferase